MNKPRKFRFPFSRNDPQADWEDAQKTGSTHLSRTPLHPLAFGKENPDPKGLHRTNLELYRDRKSKTGSQYSSHDTRDARTFTPDSEVYTGDQVHQSHHKDDVDNEINKRLEKARRHLKGNNSEER